MTSNQSVTNQLTNTNEDSATDFFSSSDPSSDLESSFFQNSPFSDDFSVLFGLS
jgi:hypothetical protein